MSVAPTFNQRLYRDVDKDGSVTLYARVDGARLGFTFHTTQAAELRRLYDVCGETAAATEAFEQGLYQGALACQTKGVSGITRFDQAVEAPSHTAYSTEGL